jgi:ankyrin repeat protein
VGDITDIEVDKSFRVSSKVGGVADNALQAMNGVIDGVTEAGLYTRMQVPVSASVQSGHVVWIKDLAAAGSSRLKQAANLPTTLVIAANEADCETARAELGADINVVTAQHCGGLESQTVLIYSFPEMKKISKPAAAASSGTKSSRPKDVLASFRYESEVLLWRLLYTMITRSSDQLVVLGRHPMFGILQGYEEGPENSVRIELLEPAKEKEAWLEIIRNHLLDGSDELAQRLFEAHKLAAFLHCSFLELQSQIRPKLVKVAKAPKKTMPPVVVSQPGGGGGGGAKEEDESPKHKPVAVAVSKQGGGGAKQRPSRSRSRVKKAKPTAKATPASAKLSPVIVYQDKRQTNKIDFSQPLGKKELKLLRNPSKALLAKIKKNHVLALLSSSVEDDMDEHVQGKFPVMIIQSFLSKTLKHLKSLSIEDDSLPVDKATDQTRFFSLLQYHVSFNFFDKGLGLDATLVLFDLFCAIYAEVPSEHVPIRVRVAGYALSCGYYDFVEAWMVQSQFGDEAFNNPEIFFRVTENASKEEGYKYALGKVTKWDTLLAEDYSPLDGAFAIRSSDVVAKLFLEVVPKEYIDLRKYLTQAVRSGFATTVKKLIDLNANVCGKPADIDLKKQAEHEAMFGTRVIEHADNYLHTAIADNQKPETVVGVVTALLAAKVDPTLRYELGNDDVPLAAAAAKGYTEVVKLLLRAKALLGPTASYEDSPLAHAVKGNQPDVVQLLLNAKASLQWGRPLRAALMASQHEVMQRLIEANANVNGVVACDDPEEGNASYMEVALERKDVSALQLLVDAKANYNRAPRPRQNAMVLMAWDCTRENKDTFDARFLELLFRAGLNPNRVSVFDDGDVSHNKRTLLGKAIRERDIGRVQFLLDAKADPNKGKPDSLPLFVAAPRPFATQPTAIRPSSNIFIALLDAKADAGSVNEYGEQPLHCVLKGGSRYPVVKPVQALLAAKAQVNVPIAGGGRSALALALEAPGSDLVEMLLAAKVDANQQVGHQEVGADAGLDLDPDADTETPLLMAIRLKRELHIKSLLKAKADPNREFGGRLPLTEAYREGKYDLMMLLLQAGAEPCVKFGLHVSLLDDMLQQYFEHYNYNARNTYGWCHKPVQILVKAIDSLLDAKADPQTEVNPGSNKALQALKKIQQGRSARLQARQSGGGGAKKGSSKHRQRKRMAR